MGLTTWSEEYSLGIAAIDQQHMTLINAIAQLEQALLAPDEKQQWAAIHYAIVQISEFTRIHFAVEEGLMQILGYPGFAEHIDQHRGFVAYLSDIERKSITYDVSQDAIVSYLRDWLISHIAGEDRKYAIFFASIKPSMAP